MFKYNIGQNMVLCLSGEAGIVVGRAEYANGENQYALRYIAADGRQVEGWFLESAIEPDVELE
jgi:hypothetical protein